MTDSQLNVALAQARGWRCLCGHDWIAPLDPFESRYSQPLADFTTDPAASLDLIEFMRGKGYSLEISTFTGKWVCLFQGHDNELRARADTFPLAVAEAAALALGISET